MSWFNICQPVFDLGVHQFKQIAEFLFVRNRFLVNLGREIFSKRIQSTTVSLKGVISIRFSVISNSACSFCSHNFRSRCVSQRLLPPSSCCLASHFHRSDSSWVRRSLDSKKSESFSLSSNNSAFFALISFFH